MFRDSDEIEAELGFDLTWEEKSENKWSNIGVRIDTDTRNPEQWPQIHEWMLDKLETIRRVFRDRVKDLDDTKWEPDA